LEYGDESPCSKGVMEEPVRRTQIGLPLVLLLLAVGCERSDPTVEIHFSPRGGCTDAIVAELDAARETVLVQAYSFTSAPIAKALVEARDRGVEVRVILDESQKSEKYTSATFLANNGIPVLIDSRHAISHNKVMVVDGRTVITGSFNFTKAAEESNAENLVVIRDGPIAGRYAANWREHAAHSEPYERAPEPSDPLPHGRAESPAPVTTPYVSSANSEVFHRAACDSAAKISLRNRIGYNARKEAVAAGKRPCQECKP
jgi:phosphatidylserine/phosphatidylglycerophosphate/cardiolipin synthase-like enzyme